MATKAWNHLLTSLPRVFTRRRCTIRSFCSSRPSVESSTKLLETFKEEFEIGNSLISFETGKIARFANGAVVMAMDETRVLSTVASAKTDAPRDFLPLTVIAQSL